MNEYIKNETFRIVMQTLEDLPPGSRNVFSRAIQGYSAKEIADEYCRGDREKAKTSGPENFERKIGESVLSFFSCGMN